MSDRAGAFRERFARRGLLVVLLAVAAGGIVLLRREARRVDASRDARVVAGAPLSGDVHGTLNGGQRYLVQVVGDRERLAALTLTRVRVIDIDSRAVAQFTPSPNARDKRSLPDGRIRQTLGVVQAPRDGDFLVRLDLTPPVTGASADSFFVARTPSGGEFSRSFGLMALGGAIFVVILAIGGIVGRSFLDRDAT